MGSASHVPFVGAERVGRADAVTDAVDERLAEALALRDAWPDGDMVALALPERVALADGAGGAPGAP